MPPFRNFLARRSVAPNSGEVDSRPDNSRSSEENRRPSPLSFRKSQENEPPEYKLSVVDVNGEYLPPSPPEKESFWHKYPGLSRSSSNHRSLVDENEPFSISRESFDSYRRSFDISARSPINHTDTLPSRTSLDSRFPRLTSPPSSSGRRPFEKQLTSETKEEDESNFEDVGLDDDTDTTKPKKKGIFSRFGVGDSTGDAQSRSSSSSSHLGFHLPGRKRGQSNPGAELSTIKSPPLLEVAEVRGE